MQISHSLPRTETENELDSLIGLVPLLGNVSRVMPPWSSYSSAWRPLNGPSAKQAKSPATANLPARFEHALLMVFLKIEV